MAGNVTDSSGDSVSKVPRDPAAADKAAQDESVPAAKQSDVADDKTARGPEGGSGGGGGEPPEPSITHLTDAPVYDPRPEYGYQLAKSLLALLAGTIFLLWVYILALDWIETHQVNETYSRIITAAAEPTLNSPEIKHIDAVLDTINNLHRRPTQTFPAEVMAETVELVGQITPRLQPAQRVYLNQCVQLMQPTPPPGPSAPGSAGQPGVDPMSPQAQLQTAAAGPTQPGTQERTALIENCIKTLESVRYAIGGTHGYRPAARDARLCQRRA